MTREELASVAKKALSEINRARIRCRQIGLAAEFVDVDPAFLRMAQMASLSRIKLNDPKASAGAVRRVAREASTVLSLVDIAEKTMRANAP